MTQVQAITYAYTAGLIDGEGSITLAYKRKNNKYRWPVVAVPSCTSELTDFLKETFGGAVSNKRRTKPGHTPSKTWSISGDKAIRFLQIIFPYLREPEKLRRTALIVGNYKNVTVRNGKYTREQQIKKLTFEHTFFEGSAKPSRQVNRMRWA